MNDRTAPRARRASLRARLITACTALFVLSPSIDAAEATSAGTAGGAAIVNEELVVLASRSEVPARTVASRVSGFSAQDLESARAAFATDLLRTLPEAQLSRTGGVGGLTQLRVRGGEANHLLALLDGFELNDPANGSEYDFAALRAPTIEGIELVSGPGGALWGADALAGTLGLRTALPDGLLLRTEAGEADSWGGTLGYGSIGDRHEVSVIADRFRTDGTNVARAGDERDGNAVDTLALRGAFSVTEALTVAATVRHVEGEVEFDPAPFPAFVPADGDRSTEFERTLLGLRADLEAGAFTHGLRIEHFASDYDEFADGSRTNGRGGERTRALLQSSVAFTAGLPGTQRLTVLGEIEREEFEQDGAPSPFGDPNQRQDLTHRSLLAEWRWSARTGLHASAVVRRDFNDAFDDATHYDLALRGTLPAALGDGWVRYGSARKNPGFTERFGFTPDTFAGNPDLRPERGNALELGWTRGFAEDRAVATLVYHRTRLEDEIDGFVFDPVSGLFTAGNRDRDSRRDGVEANLTLRPTARTTLALRYAFLDASEPDATGNTREIRRARHSFGSNLTHRLASVPLVLRLDATRLGERRDNDFGTFPATPVDLEDAWLVDVTGSWRVADGLSVFLRAEDLFAEAPQEVFGFASPGRTLRAGIEYRSGGAR